MAVIIETEDTLENQDIALATGTPWQFFSLTKSGAGWVASELRIPSGELNGAAANFTVGLLHFLADGTTKIGDYIWTQPKFAAADTHFAVNADPIWVADGEKVVWYIQSTNAADSSVDLDCTWLDPYGAVDVAKWLGTAPLGLSSQRVQVDVQAIDALADAATVLGLWLAMGKAPIADSGTTTTLVDGMLTQADDYWNGALLVFRGGTNIGRTAIITDFDAATDTLTFAPAVPDAVTTEEYVLVPGLGHADIAAISQDTTAADKLKLQFNGIGYVHDTAPATQLQLSGLAGGLSIPFVAESKSKTEGAETNDYDVTQSHDENEYVVTDIGSGIDFYLQFDIGEQTSTPVVFHLHGWFEDPNPDSGVSISIQAYNWNTSGWQTIEVLEDGLAEEEHMPELNATFVGEDGGDEGIVQIRFVASGSEEDNAMHINHCSVGAVNALRTDADGYILLSDGTGTGQVSLSSGVIAANVVQWLSQACEAVDDNGIPNVNLVTIDGDKTDGTPAVASRPILYLQQLNKHCDISAEGADHSVNDSVTGYARYENGGEVGRYTIGGQVGDYVEGVIVADILLGGTGTIVDGSGNDVIEVGCDKTMQNAIPGSPTANSINELVAHFAEMTADDGAVRQFTANALELLYTVDLDQVEAAAAIDSLCTLILAAFHGNLVDNAGKLTVYQTDDETEVNQFDITSSDTASPLTGVSD